MNVFKIAFATAGIAVLTLTGAAAVHGSDGARSENLASSRKMARTHSSSARTSKKERSKTKRRAVIDRERAREETEIEEENIAPPPPVDLPRHEDGSENDVKSDENGSGHLMGTTTETADNGGP
jgi:hypothetical protein